MSWCTLFECSIHTYFLECRGEASNNLFNETIGFSADEKIMHLHYRFSVTVTDFQYRYSCHPALKVQQLQ